MFENEADILEKFKNIERDTEIFSIYIQGVRIWERIRHKIYKKILKNKNLIGESHTSSDFFEQKPVKLYTLFGYRWLKSLVANNPFLSSQRDILIYGSTRRKKREDSYWWDIYSDPITDNLNLDYLQIEKRLYADSHKKPPKTNNLKYIDIIKDSGRIQREIGLADVSLNSSEVNIIRKIEHKFTSKFDVCIDLQNEIKNLLSKRKAEKWMYDWLIRKINPEIVLITASSYKKNFIESCKEKDATVVELQHGIIYENNFKHDFPDGINVPTYPDYLFTFGEYWCENINYPINNKKVIPVGYPYLEIESKKYDNINSQNQILFISQGPIGQELSKFACELTSYVDYDIIYKLHPGEYDRWNEQYPWLKNADLRVIEDDEPPLYRLFAESKIQVGVGSTALYEGLIFDLDTYILDMHGKHAVSGLINDGNATLIRSVEDLLAKMGNQSKSGVDIERIFKPNAVENIDEALNRIVSEEE